jgi:hypothetical protein
LAPLRAGLYTSAGKNLVGQFSDRYSDGAARVRSRIHHHRFCLRENTMSKEKAKKAPQKTLKEKRKEKKEKRGGKGISNL